MKPRVRPQILWAIDPTTSLRTSVNPPRTTSPLAACSVFGTKLRFLLTRERPAVTEVVAWAAGNGVTRDVKAQYTADAMRAKVRGSVVLRGIVDISGTVRDVRVEQSLEPSLDVAAREAFAQWEFRPAMRRGQPVAIAISVQMAFTTP
jgi:TonB family protein